MPTDDAYDAVLAELKRLSEAWQVYREVINRAVGSLNHEVISFTDRLDKDDEAREKRQAQVDAKLESITTGQDAIRRNQIIRFVTELIIIITIVAYILGRSL